MTTRVEFTNDQVLQYLLLHAARKDRRYGNTANTDRLADIAIILELDESLSAMAYVDVCVAIVASCDHGDGDFNLEMATAAVDSIEDWMHDMTGL